MTGPRRAAPIALWLLVIALIVEVGLLVLGRVDLPTMGLAHVAVFSLVAFFAFTWDKWRATRGGNRVREATLIGVSVAGGALGGLAAMLAARHKTRRPAFWFVLCASLFVHIVIVGWLFISR